MHFCRLSDDSICFTLLLTGNRPKPVVWLRALHNCCLPNQRACFALFKSNVRASLFFYLQTAGIIGSLHEMIKNLITGRDDMNVMVLQKDAVWRE